MNTFFVQDLWQWRYFFSQKQSFYALKEKRLDWWLVLLFLIPLTYLFIERFLSFRSGTLYLSCSLLLIALFFVVFYVYKDKTFAYKFLPFVFLAFVNLLSFVFLIYFKENLLLSFRFLFSESLTAKIRLILDQDAIATPKEANFYRNIAENIVFSFYTSIIKFIFLFILLTVNFARIKKTLLDLFRNRPTTLLFFFLFVIAINLINFSANGVTTQQLSTDSNTETSTNQSAIQQIITNSSGFNRSYYYVGLLVLAPLWEETIFRYAIFAIFGRKRVVWAIVFAVFFFTVIHYSPEDFRDIETSFVGFVEKIFSPRLFAYIYGSIILTSLFWFYDLNLFFPIFFHFMWNFNVTF